jgi:hypothetical protein
VQLCRLLVHLFCWLCHVISMYLQSFEEQDCKLYGVCHGTQEYVVSRMFVRSFDLPCAYSHETHKSVTLFVPSPANYYNTEISKVFSQGILSLCLTECLTSRTVCSIFAHSLAARSVFSVSTNGVLPSVFPTFIFRKNRGYMFWLKPVNCIVRYLERYKKNVYFTMMSQPSHVTIHV